MRLYVDRKLDGIIGNPEIYGLTTAEPLDGDEQAPIGAWDSTFPRDLNDHAIFPLDGRREVIVTAEDVAGNLSAQAVLVIMIDTQGPRIVDPDGAGSLSGVHISDDPATAVDESTYDLFAPKPTDGPTPLVRKLTIHMSDSPARAAGFLYGAVNQVLAQQLGHYRLRGDRNGNVPITSIVVTNAPAVAGKPANATVELSFGSPLPDDRYEITIGDGLMDDAGNRLDGETDAVPTFPSGDGVPGGQFIARFTVDSRAEIGSYFRQRVGIDLNGNFVFDPNNADSANRDATFVWGGKSDTVFAGNFAAAGAVSANGFDKLGAYGREKNKYRWLLDLNGDGAFDPAIDARVVNSLKLSGVPVAGNFDPAHPGDEVGLYKGTGKWYLDSNGNNNIEKGDTVLKGNLKGKPMVGDFDGDGLEDLGSWHRNRFDFDLAADGLDGMADVTISGGFTPGQEKPVAGDMDGDGIDDIALVARNRHNTDINGEVVTAQWYVLVSNDYDGTIRVPGTVNTLDHAFNAGPFGHDLFTEFGDVGGMPLIGNFDPPAFTPDSDMPNGRTLRNSDAALLGYLDDGSSSDTVPAVSDTAKQAYFSQLGALSVDPSVTSYLLSDAVKRGQTKSALRSRTGILG